MTIQASFLPAIENPKIKTLALRDQPVYRVSINPSACNTLELLAAIIGGPHQIEIAERLLACFEGDIRLLHNAPAEAITARVHGIGPQTAARIKAAFALGMMFTRPTEERPSVNSPGDAYELLKDMAMFEQEHMRVILLNTRMQVLGVQEVYVGAVNNIQIRLAEIFRPAIQRNASMIILAHNHPSGDPTPSPDDIAVTRAAVQAGKMVDLEVQDHLIVGSNRYESLKSKGLGFSSD